MDMIMSPADTGNHLLAKSNISAGVKIGAKIVDTAVTATDNAVFPLAKKVMTFDAVPPGQQPTKMTPTATSAGKSKPTARPKASKGIIVYCETTPIKTLFGCFPICLKSSKLSVSPIPNIIIPNNKDTCGAIQLKPLGIKNDKTANNKTQIANVFPANVPILSNVFTLIPPLYKVYCNKFLIIQK